MNTTMENRITNILENDVHARNSDGYLFVKVCEDIYAGDLSRLSVYDVMLSDEFPNYETVRRTRQVVQENRIDLASDRTVRKWRKKQQDRWLEYLRSKK